MRVSSAMTGNPPLLAWAVRAELQYSGKAKIQKRLAQFRNPQSFIDRSMERSIKYNLFD